jgi:flagellar biosynthetic protein FliR
LGISSGISSLYQFPEGQIIAFALVLLRLLAFFISWPIFGVSTVPTPIKVLLSVAVALMMFPVVKFSGIDLIKISDEVILLSIRELAIGLCLGFMMRMFFFTVSAAGDIISVSIGLGSAQLFNPTIGGQSGVTEQFQVTLATLFFLAINGHHLFIAGLASSFEIVPVAKMSINTEAFTGFVVAAQNVFSIGLRIASPVVVAIFLSNITMGVIGRAVPQINVLVTSFPITILVGVSVMIITIPLVLGEMNVLLEVMSDSFMKMMKVL